MKKNWPSTKHFFADGAHERRQLMDKAKYIDFIVEIVKSILFKKDSSRFKTVG